MDRRIRKTTNAIKAALIHLLKTEPLDKITIQQIADTADVHRATFYQHYYDKYDLLDQIEYEVLEKMRVNFNDKAKQLKALNSVEEAAIVFKEIPKAMLTMISEDIERYQVLLSSGRNHEIEQKIGDMIALNLKSLLPNPDEIEGIPFRYFHAFVLGSMWSLMRIWVLDEERLPIDAQVENIYKLMYEGPWKMVYRAYRT
ncbi:TetR/AcrR family transcriptional regulator [Staphylococcus pseudintermedius]|uniref:TetR/AcrR family transcriptional regulator n=1 Tax=Staphylococcus pseudintermedius TaxID=283734 RepID=UPI0019FA9281|nr:TetR family transcriptional regulator [Staphylococcus pseudintermedius]EGQ3669298.1 TetR/AcrR family transcriptional regulator [Staphylococcus pseudintermedius]EJO7127459.1 TetR/AcrR family transcriptional regulator [Staphylococcus pseudintermedius]ELD8126663.1 TetR/AcrR family transcriptional regulator [Staphylococcus pseudintermedius]ELD8171713.1 TetR/AcrR family transcriptional regulator [Staphylococcus pseudintermedius]ELX9440769.1 TetR/AcrR family transcriptional regulator [Staphylococ